MAQATLSVRLDSTDKQYFEEFCKSAGLNVSVAINMFVKAVIKKQRIPFEIEGTPISHSDDPFYSDENMKRIREAVAEIDAGHYTIHEPIEVR